MSRESKSLSDIHINEVISAIPLFDLPRYIKMSQHKVTDIVAMAANSRSFLAELSAPKPETVHKAVQTMTSFIRALDTFKKDNPTDFANNAQGTISKFLTQMLSDSKISNETKTRWLFLVIEKGYVNSTHDKVLQDYRAQSKLDLEVAQKEFAKLPAAQQIQCSLLGLTATQAKQNTKEQNNPPIATQDFSF